MTEVKQSQVIYDYLISYINEEDHKVGDKLPTEKQLCSMFNVSRSTVREAVIMLQGKGYVDVIKGSGTYIRSKAENTVNNILTIENLRDFMEIRISIETLAVRLFIAGYSDAKWEKLNAVEKKFEKAVRDKKPIKMADYDELFHKTIFECTDNELLISIGELLSNSFRSYREKTFEVETHRQDAISAHRKILESMKRKDTDETIFNIRQHLDTSYENALK